MFKILKEDIETVFLKDPAARTVAEVLLCYPGLHAIWLHRIAHWFWKMGFKLIARIISHISRFFTGIEIHPAAKIGRRFFIDHGMGIVIGETAEIGDDVLMYKGAVLGGSSFEKKKRHPTVEDHVIIGTNAVILGPVRIGRCSKIGAGSVVVKDVPPNTTVVGVPGRTVEDRRKCLLALNHGNLPDPLATAVEAILKEQDKINKRLNLLEKLNNLSDGDKYEAE